MGNRDCEFDRLACPRATLKVTVPEFEFRMTTSLCRRCDALRTSLLRLLAVGLEQVHQLLGRLSGGFQKLLLVVLDGLLLGHGRFVVRAKSMHRLHRFGF